jgi:hypothetical protein
MTGSAEAGPSGGPEAGQGGPDLPEGSHLPDRPERPVPPASPEDDEPPAGDGGGRYVPL